VDRVELALELPEPSFLRRIPHPDGRL
jgi:hypothetical protein